MKISDFELGKKYSRKGWGNCYVEYNSEGWGNCYVEYNEDKVLTTSNELFGKWFKKIYIPNFKDTSADDWVEFKIFSYKDEKPEEGIHGEGCTCGIEDFLEDLLQKIIKNKKGDK